MIFDLRPVSRLLIKTAGISMGDAGDALRWSERADWSGASAGCQLEEICGVAIRALL